MTILFIFLYVGANPLYSVQSVILSQRHVAIVCTLACRTSIIRGCNVTLSQGQRTVSQQSENIMGTSNEISGNNVSIIFAELEPDISLNNPISYSARAIAQTSNSISEFGEQVDGVVSMDFNCEYV